MIPIAIVAHRCRETMAEQLAETTKGCVFYDDGILGCDRNHLRVWKHHADNTRDEWSVVLEDDAVPVPGFCDQLAQALAVAPAPIVSLYLGTSRPLNWQGPVEHTLRQIRRTNAAWITTPALLHAVGVAIQTPLISSLVQWLPELDGPIDEAITKWAKGYGHLVAYTWPSLVDHADGPTLFAHPDNKPRDRRRIAHHAAGRRAWNSQHVYMTPPNP